eukprot:1187382-Prorocentrum_minimum.AAC.1
MSVWSPIYQGLSLGVGKLAARYGFCGKLADHPPSSGRLFSSILECKTRSFRTPRLWVLRHVSLSCVDILFSIPSSLPGTDSPRETPPRLQNSSRSEAFCSCCNLRHRDQPPIRVDAPPPAPPLRTPPPLLLPREGRSRNAQCDTRVTPPLLRPSPAAPAPPPPPSGSATAPPTQGAT